MFGCSFGFTVSQDTSTKITTIRLHSQPMFDLFLVAGFGILDLGSIVVFVVVVVVVALHPKLSLVARIDGLATRSGLCGSGSESYPATQVQEWAVEERVFD